MSIDGKSVPAVMDFVATAVVAPTSWTHATALEPQPPLATAMPVLLAAQYTLQQRRYSAALARLKDSTVDPVAWLIWPI